MEFALSRSRTLCFYSKHDFPHWEILNALATYDSNLVKFSGWQIHTPVLLNVIDMAARFRYSYQWNIIFWWYLPNKIRRQLRINTIDVRTSLWIANRKQSLTIILLQNDNKMIPNRFELSIFLFMWMLINSCQRQWCRIYIIKLPLSKIKYHNVWYLSDVQYIRL